jgi:hypothetical protein
MNLTVQEILKQIKAGDAKDENMILQELEEKNAHICETIPKVNYKMWKNVNSIVSLLIVFNNLLVEKACCENSRFSTTSGKIF